MLALGLRERDKGLAYLNAAVPLLAVTLLSLPVVIWTGHAWAGSLDYLDGGTLRGWLPAEGVLKGFLRRHVILAACASVALLAALPFSIAARNRRLTSVPALVLTLAGAILLAAASHA